MFKKCNINRKCYSSYGKNLGFKYESIKQILAKNTPILINVTNDGRDYYTSHSILIIGYSEFEYQGKIVRLLKVYDNWHSEICYLDYSKLGTISSIIYFR